MDRTRDTLVSELVSMSSSLHVVEGEVAQLRARLDALLALLNEAPQAEPATPSSEPEPMPQVVPPPVELPETTGAETTGAETAAANSAVAETGGASTATLTRAATRTRLTVRTDLSLFDELPHLELNKPLYLWQQEAVQAWNDADRQGVVEAVTGAGKTMVGLQAIIDALTLERQRVVVMAPTTTLVNQWTRAIRQQLPGLQVSNDHRTEPGWHVLIDTVQTLCRESPLSTGENALLIADETHRYGAPTFSRALREAFTARLGLTATYERGEEGDALLHTYFGSVVFRLGYARALAENVIAPFRVLLAGVHLTPAERGEYDALTATMSKARATVLNALGLPGDMDSVAILKLAGRVSGQRGNPAAGAARAYLAATTKRRDLLAQADEKYRALETLAPVAAESGGTIVFTQTTASALRAAQTLQESGVASASVHGAMGDDEREERLDLFRTGEVPIISAPRILDEGVDVPDADLGVIVAASRSRRQMIQRLGRVVRRKQDGRDARLVVLYAVDTVEDPGTETVPEFLDEIISNAHRNDRLTLPGENTQATEFLAR